MKPKRLAVMRLAHNALHPNHRLVRWFFSLRRALCLRFTAVAASKNLHQACSSFAVYTAPMTMRPTNKPRLDATGLARHACALRHPS